jgi:hypothetical protein
MLFAHIVGRSQANLVSPSLQPLTDYYLVVGQEVLEAVVLQIRYFAQNFF